MWVNKAERAWRRRGEARELLATAQDGERRFAAFALAVELLLADVEGRAWLDRYGIESRWCMRSVRVGKGGALGLSVLEGVVLSATCSRLLDDASLVRWMSRKQPAALQALHDAAAPLGSPCEASRPPRRD